MRVGGSYFGSAALFYFNSNVDPAVVGRLFGVTQLGYYQTAFSFPEELRSRMATATVRILFPAFALLQSNHAAFRANVLQSLRIFAAIVVPTGAGMAIVADPIVRVLYGSQWAPVVPFLQVAALIGITRALQAFVVNIYKAKARPDLEFKIGIGLIPLLLLSVLGGSLFGPLGVAAGLLIFSIASLAATYPALRLIQLDAQEVLQALCPAVIASAAMCGVLRLLDSMHMIPNSTDAVELAASVGIGVVIFVVVLLGISRKTVGDFWSVVRMLRVR
jgi:O-antigen/teichoic acid export membrane protein